MNFEEHLKKYLSKEEINELLEAINKERTHSLILNNRKISDEQFSIQFPKVQKSQDIKNLFYYSNDAYQFGKSYLFDNGAYYIIDAGSALVSKFLPIENSDLILDFCAAPGGKTISTILNNLDKKFEIISNDISFKRALTLSSNIERLGIANVSVICNDFSKNYTRYENTFDKIILDAPCSGSAMFRKQEDVKEDWSYEKVLSFSKIQKELISQAYYMLKPGGFLIYSTCSFSYEEDEEVIQFLLTSYSDTELIPLNIENKFYSSKSLQETIHIFPYLYQGEGQFIALIHKKPSKTPIKFKKNDELYISCPYFNSKEINFKHYELLNENINAYNNDFNFKYIEHVLKKGLIIGEYKNKIFKPSFHLAHYLSSNNSIKLNEEEAKLYLHGDCIIKNNLNLKNDYYVVSFNNINLGFIKNINGTLKNLYPKGLRH